MNNRTQWMEDIQKNLSDLIARSPAADVERNVRAMMTQAFSKLDLVTREEFDVQADLLARTRARVDQLAAQVEQLETRLSALENNSAPAVCRGRLRAAFLSAPGGTDLSRRRRRRGGLCRYWRFASLSGGRLDASGACQPGPVRPGFPRGARGDPPWPGPAQLQCGGPARHRGAREPRTGARGHPEQRIRVSARTHHRQSFAGRHTQGIRPLRSAHRPGAAAGFGQLAAATGEAGPAPAPAALADLVLAGELSLTGALVPVAAPLVIALSVAREAPGASLILPAGSAEEAAWVPGLRVLSARSLADVAAHAAGACRLPDAIARPWPDAGPGPCLSDVRGQPGARRALEVAAAGGHSLLMIGPPGAGKSMLAARLPGLLPPLARAEALEAAAVAALAGLPDAPMGLPPFRAPHHSASAAALVGGGSRPRPGEISLAHHGVLFLTNCRNSAGARWRPCASRWRRAGWSSRGRCMPRSFRRASSWSPP